MKDYVRLFQLLTHRAWSAKETVNYKGWLVRLSEGVTMRVNSVLPLEYNGDNLRDDIQIVEEMYRNRNLPLIFQIPDYYEPNNLVSFLEELGFQQIDETIVMSINLNEKIPTEEGEDYNFIIEEQVSDEWFRNLQELSGFDNNKLKGFKSIISRTLNTNITCSLKIDEIIVSVVLGVIEEPFIAIFNLIVDTNHRRQGIGEFVMRKVLSYAKQKNLETMYLQVEANNLPAVKLYEKLGFNERFRYRYLVKETEKVNY